MFCYLLLNANNTFSGSLGLVLIFSTEGDLGLASCQDC